MLRATTPSFEESMAPTSVSSSPNPFIPFLYKSTPPQGRFHLPITCSKRKKKASSKPKVLSPVKSSKLKLSPIEDLHLGIGSGASTLTALQPLINDDGPFPQAPPKLPQDLVIDSLSRFTLASTEYSDFLNVKIGDSVHDIEYMNDDNEIAPDDNEEEFEWVEVNAEDDDVDDESEENADERYIYWEGDLGPMTKEEEAELLEEAKKELARLEMEKKTVGKQVFKHSLIFNGGDDTEETDDEELQALFLEAETALAELEAKSHKMGSREITQVVAGEKYEEEEEEEDDDEEAVFPFQIGNEIGREDDKKHRVKSHKRAVPAIMRSFDRAKVYVKAGNGGNGVVAFRREKYVPFGGPSGGSGGRGGHIYIEADPSMNSLLAFRKSVHFRAGRGAHGQGKSQDGAAGEDCIIKVPLGTVIRQATDDLEGPGEVLLELLRPHQRELLLPGGRGGRGNTAFKTGRNKTPQLAENGEEGAEMWLTLELKLVADVGIIGVPNAGKSTLLSVISAAQPAIGAYPFTTLLPNLGVVPVGFESSMVVADLPGLLEGAHLGIGLGHEFLRHTERCRVLVHVVDGMSQQPEHEYEAVRQELELFNLALSEKPYVVVFNKMDIPEVAERWDKFEAYMMEKGIEAICMSAATKMGTEEVVKKAYSLLQSLPKPTFEDDAHDSPGKNDNQPVGEVIRKQRSAPIEEFEIFGDAGSKLWRVEGIGLERFTQMTNWEYFESLKRFQHVLDISGVNNALRSHGVEEGDTVIVGQMEFVWQDTEDILATDWKRSYRGSKVWPH